ncbi:Type 4 prepilin-like proteins leader peptide-processing enzyme [Lacunisphaera limnophila]|uniref:Type 4 prepilin-like proteins leader peptide-processing enzyme n=1 Tax=Lacunisphaera limnophila TaxID=1838286 RepID=A0A1D8ASP5_9BACT|nr:A24 family peptidase [Lacunisphaera limnophila]AOS43919.1 Type 4 prepilin-like proteins leader peptide-processing enzyme [Lacunisphaera limnophila]
MIDHLQEINLIAPWFFPLWVGLTGACIGSFLNVCIYRIPQGRSVVTPRSHCGCGTMIAWYDNIPVLSWFLLRGRARCCGRPFSFRYPAIELLTAALFVACWRLFPPGQAFAGAVLCCIVICAHFIDHDHMIIPDVFTLGGAAVGVLLSLLLPSLHGHTHEIWLVAGLRSGVDAVLGVFIGSALILWVALFAEVLLKKEAMGFGDVKYLGALGAFVGWQGAVFGLFGGAILGCIWFIGAYGWQKLTGRASPVALPAETPEGQPAELGFGVHVPFGPMLGLAALIYFFWAHRMVDAYFAELALLL